MRHSWISRVFTNRSLPVTENSRPNNVCTRIYESLLAKMIRKKSIIEIKKFTWSVQESQSDWGGWKERGGGVARKRRRIRNPEICQAIISYWLLLLSLCLSELSNKRKGSGRGWISFYSGNDARPGPEFPNHTNYYCVLNYHHVTSQICSCRSVESW